MSYSARNDFSAFDLHLLGEGRHWELYRFLGAHPAEENGVPGWRFAVWAPRAKAVSVAGDFNNWDWEAAPLLPVEQSGGVWAAFVPGARAGQRYKFGIRARDGALLHKADPLAFAAELRPGNASVTAGLGSHAWNDADWMRRRAESPSFGERPMSIYEVHAGSWRRKDGNGWLSYADLARELIPHVRDLGFTHIEFLPLAEHPLDESWGYQTGGYFAPTSRFGSPDELRGLVDACHQAGLGVILDWVPAHFPKDSFALARFDGAPLYEYADPRRAEHPDWGTLVFDYGRPQVRNFLIANALYWLKEFHFDGLRVDAVSSMLYLDYSRKAGGWVPNSLGGREHLEAMDFLRELNAVVHEQVPGAITCAEEASAWPGVTRPSKDGGLGFDCKWNMGWMHDSLDYLRIAPQQRRARLNALTFSLTYAFSERFLLPLSHDEVVHGKASLFGKMPGGPEQKLANLRLLYAWMWAHPGKKLLFMGGEFGQKNEWSEARSLDWPLPDSPDEAGRAGLGTLLRDLNALYREEPAMHAKEHGWEGFTWLDCKNNAAPVLAFLRVAPGERPLLWAFNFSPAEQRNYAVPCPLAGAWNLRLNTDSRFYGGRDGGSGGRLCSTPGRVTGRPLPSVPHEDRLLLTLPPLAALALQAEEALP